MLGWKTLYPPKPTMTNTASITPPNTAQMAAAISGASDPCRLSGSSTALPGCSGS